MDGLHCSRFGNPVDTGGRYIAGDSLQRGSMGRYYFEKMSGTGQSLIARLLLESLYQHSLQFPRWQAITAIDIVLEIMLVLYPVRVISRLQTSLNKKFIVLVILSCRVVYVRYPSLPWLEEVLSDTVGGYD